jgi:putative exosortase-associated protein (TIGR04073 family)
VEIFCPQAARADDAGTKLGRGLSNLLLGWGEYPRQLEIAWKEKNYNPGTFIGLVRGTGKTFQRMFVGLFEILTFPFPGKQRYGPILLPETAFSEVGKKSNLDL